MKTLATWAAALLVPIAAAASPATVHLEELTSVEVAARVASARTIAIVPIGGTEQNGPRLVLGKHNVRVRVLAEEIALTLGNALVAPVIAYVPEGSIDPPTGHMKGAGTLSIPTDAFEKTLEAAARSLLRHGFSHVVFLGDHGGYQASLRRVAGRLDRAFARPVALVPAGYYREVAHAGRADTELALAVDPRLVREPGGVQVEAGRRARAAIVAATVESIRKSLAR